MAITLKADNRQLTKNAKLSYLSTNYAAAVSSLVIVNSNGFAANDYVLLGEFGSETSEIVQATTVTASTHTLTLGTATKFAHPETTKATILPYNQVRFYWTATATYATTTAVTSYIDVQADDFFTKASDTTHTTGFGWFVFYNSTTTTATVNSNAIPYADFGANSVKKIFDSFFSLLNNNELRLVSNDDAFRWLNEGYAIAQNELNLINTAYTVPAPYAINVSSGTQEYALPDDFGGLVSVTADADGTKIESISLKDVPEHDSGTGVVGVTTQYYLRGSYIGFSPSPTSSATYNLFYTAKTGTLTSYYDNITLPDNNFYPLVDFMMYRASQKLQKSNPKVHMEAFRDGINLMKITSIKQNADNDSWGIDPTANV